MHRREKAAARMKSDGHPCFLEIPAKEATGISYSKLMGGLKKADIRINRKMLAQLAVTDPKCFSSIADNSKG